MTVAGLFKGALSPTALAIVAFLSLALGVYGTFYYERKPFITFEVLSNSTVVDVRETLSKLEIIYAGSNLRSKNQNLRVVTFRVLNSGNADILKNYYDDRDPLGVILSAGEIVEQPTLVASEYLMHSVNPILRSPATVTFAPVILNSGDSFVIKLLVLVSGDATPELTPIGTIAGITQKFEVIEPYKEARQYPFWTEAFAGPPHIQGVRLAGYFGLALLTIALIVVVIAVPVTAANKVLENYKKAIRQTRVATYLANLGRHATAVEKALFERYIENDPAFGLFVDFLAWGKSNEFSLTGTMFKSIDNVPGSFSFLKNAGPRAFASILVAQLEGGGLLVRDGPQVTIPAAAKDAAIPFLAHARPDLTPALAQVAA